MLENFRDEIDIIDEQIMTLLDKRFAVCVKVMKLKKQNSLQTLDKTREENIINKARTFNFSEEIVDVYQDILTLSKNLYTKL